MYIISRRSLTLSKISFALLHLHSPYSIVPTFIEYYLGLDIQRSPILTIKNKIYVPISSVARVWVLMPEVVGSSPTSGRFNLCPYSLAVRIPDFQSVGPQFESE